MSSVNQSGITAGIVSSSSGTGNVQVKSVKTIRFDGDEKDWREWSRKVLAYFKQQGWSDAILNPDQADDEIKGKALNFLVMSLSGLAFTFVQDATDAGEVWSELVDEFEPNEDVDIYDIQESFTKCKLKSEKENPTMWFKRMEHLNFRLGSIDKTYMKTDDDLKVHTMVNLPQSEYGDLITSVRKTVKKTSWRDLKKDIKSHWRRMVRVENEETRNSTNNNEIVLNTYQQKVIKQEKSNFTKFKGRCSYCGKYGHKRADCMKKKSDEGKSSKLDNKKSVRCFKCGKLGHFASQCKSTSNPQGANMFVGSIVTSDITAPKTYAEAVKNETDPDVAGLFSESESELEDGEIHEEKVNVINEASRIKGQLSRHGDITPCDYPAAATKKRNDPLFNNDLTKHHELLPDRVESHQFNDGSPKKKLKCNWDNFRSCMDDFVEKFEIGKEMLRVI